MSGPRVIKELWLVEAVSLHDDGMLVEFDSRQEGEDGKRSEPSIIVAHDDGDTQVQVDHLEGEYYARRIGKMVEVTLTIGREEPPQVQVARP